MVFNVGRFVNIWVSLWGYISCQSYMNVVESVHGAIVLQGELTSILDRMGVMLMKNQNKNNFDFKDLMTFGLFLLALLTFVFTFCK